jgi:MtaA/CmuA family methyltransferase
MDSRERFMAVLAGETPDMVPIIPVVDGYYAPRVIDRANDECWLEENCLADSLAAAFRRYGYDGVMAEMGLGPEPNVLGCPVQMAGNDVPLIVETIIGGREDIEKIPVPDPWAGGKMKPVERLIADVGTEAVVLGSVRSPFEYAASVRGLMEFMTDFYRDPGLVRDLIEACMPATLAVGQALAQAGVDALVMKESFASSSLISPQHYEEFAFPSEAEVIGELKSEVPVILHVCRNSMPILPMMARTGAAALEIDSPVDLAQAREAVGDKIVLKGNIDAVSVIEKGSRDDVEQAVRQAMAAAKGRGPFILSTGDSIPVNSPEENLAALVEFGRQYGRY